MGQRGGALGSTLGSADVAFEVAGPPLSDPGAEQLQAAGDAGEQVVEVVRETAGELADRLHLLALAQRVLDRLALAQGHGDALLQRFVQLLQALLGFELGADVGIGAEPANQLSGFVAYRLGAGQERAVEAIGGAKQVDPFPRDARSPSGGHFRDGIVHLVRVMDRAPAPALHRCEVGAGVGIPAPVVPEHASVRVGHPGQLVDILDESLELAGLGKQLLLGAPPLDRHAGAMRDLTEEGQILGRPLPGGFVIDIQQGHQTLLLGDRHVDEGLGADPLEGGGTRPRALVLLRVADDSCLAAFQIVYIRAVVAEPQGSGNGSHARGVPVPFDRDGLGGQVDGAVAGPAHAQSLADDLRGRIG